MGSCRAATSGAAGEQSAEGRVHPYGGSRRGRRYLCGRRHPVPWAGLGGAAAGAKELQPPARSLLPGVSHKGQFCLLKWVAFCFDEWARS